MPPQVEHRLFLIILSRDHKDVVAAHVETALRDSVLIFYFTVIVISFEIV